jgi:predicted outer membrane repeat protein
MGIVQVTTTADSGSGSLRAAIASAQAGDTIQFAASLAGKTIRLTSGQLTIPPGKSLTIDGSKAANLTVSGNNQSRIFWVNSNQDRPITLTLKNLTLADAYTADQGGAIKGEHRAVIQAQNVKFNNNVADKGGGAIFSAWENTLTVTGCQFNRNKAIAGNDERGAGAIAFVSPGAITVRNSQFSNNRGINGAAINSLNGKLTVDRCKFINNDTNEAKFGTGNNAFLRGYGGAIYTDRGNDSIVIKKSTFQGNSSKASGGAVHLFADPEDVVSIESSVFTKNQATGLAGSNDKGKGGAIAHIRNSIDPRGKFTITNSTIANNTGYDQGGGLWVYSVRTTITNSTFSGNKIIGNSFSNVGGGMTLYSDTDITNTTIANNSAGWVGGGISAVEAAKVTVKNSIFYKNTANQGGQQTSRTLLGSSNLQFPPTSGDPGATPNIQFADPKLGPLQNNGGGIPTHELLKGSPAINRGLKAGAPTTDGRGFKRTDGKVDIGAFEFGAVQAAKKATRQSALSSNRSHARTDLALAPSTDALTGWEPHLRVGQSDVLLDNLQAGDWNVAIGHRPKLFNAGILPESRLVDAARAAYADKNQIAPGQQTLASHEAVFFSMGSRTYLSVNNGRRSFSSAQDWVLDVTGLPMAPGDESAGKLNPRNYFGS